MFQQNNASYYLILNSLSMGWYVYYCDVLCAIGVLYIIYDKCNFIKLFWLSISPFSLCDYNIKYNYKLFCMGNLYDVDVCVYRIGHYIIYQSAWSAEWKWRSIKFPSISGKQRGWQSIIWKIDIEKVFIARIWTQFCMENQLGTFNNLFVSMFHLFLSQNVPV